MIVRGAEAESVEQRDRPELRRLIGCLVNPLALRVPLALRASFRSQLLRERAMVLEVLEYRELPFSRVVAAVSPERKLDEHPLFQLLFSWETETPAEPEPAETRFSLLSLPAERASYFDLECLLRDAGEGQPLCGYFAWSTAVLEDWVARQLAPVYSVLLTAIAAISPT